MDLQFFEGQRVTYKTHGKKAKGIIKSIPDDKFAFVVFHCNDDWENYKDYTGQRTNII